MQMEKNSYYSSQLYGLKSSEQHPSDANVMLCFSVCGSHICQEQGKREWVI